MTIYTILGVPYYDYVCEVAQGPKKVGHQFQVHRSAAAS